ncbi:MAG: hypothetical protein MR809_10020 [Rikenellaceae bacterium]|nr:hypothetical protein [Rikenellaceae bacterium]
MYNSELNYSKGDYVSPRIDCFCHKVEAGVTGSGNAKFDGNGVGISAYIQDEDL